jgi:hypothetical protein
MVMTVFVQFSMTTNSQKFGIAIEAPEGSMMNLPSDKSVVLALKMF